MFMDLRKFVGQMAFIGGLIAFWTFVLSLLF